MTAEISSVYRNHIRVNVEPIDVEINNEDGSVFLSSLQSAFPGSSGLYYTSADGRGTKVAVRFDGERLLPPGGDWQDREYYVKLTGRGAHLPLTAYRSAVKDFENSVNLVSQLMGNAGTTLRSTRTTGNRIDNVKDLISKIQFAVQGESASRKSSIASSVGGVPAAKISVLQQTAAALEERDLDSNNLTSLEQQFVDLAKLSNAKDSVIDSQRNKLKKLAHEIERLNKQLNVSREHLDVAKARLTAQEDELSLLRQLGREQTTLSTDVSDLLKQLVAAKNEGQAKADELSAKLEAANTANEKIKEELNEKDLHVSRLASSIEVVENERNGLKKALEDANEHIIQLTAQTTGSDEEKAAIVEKLGLPILKAENEILQRKNKELLQERAEIKELWDQKIDEAIRNAVKRNNELASEAKGQEEKIRDLLETVDKMARENKELAERIDNLKSERDELRRNTAHLESRVDGNNIDFATPPQQ